VSTGYAFAVTTENESKSNVMTKQLAADMAVVRQGKILFSHHSVGANIIMGVKQLDAIIPEEGRLHFVTLENAATSKGPALIDISGGRNGEPKTKIDFFIATIRDKIRLKPDLAFMKLCFVDFNPQTNVDDLFGYYRSAFDALMREYPEIRFMHVTVPLTTRPTGLKWNLFRLIGREVWEDMANIKRAEFNRRLKESFGADTVFDLARIEATAPNGQLTTFEQGGQSYFSLYPGYTDDGGHLNTLGQQIVGAEAIRFMADGLKHRRTAF
jgi:hypothetical protein